MVVSRLDSMPVTMAMFAAIVLQSEFVSLLFLDNRFENDPLKVVKNEANAVIVAFTSAETTKFSKDATSASAFFCCSSTAFLNSAILAVAVVVDMEDVVVDALEEVLDEVVEVVEVA